MKETYGDKVRLVFRDFPLNTHAEAFKAAEAAQCAHEQGKFWEYHDALFENQSQLGIDKLKEYAAALELDAGAFATCLDEGQFSSDVQADLDEGQSYGVNATPAFFINGRLLSGAQPFEEFQRIIDDELDKLSTP